MAPIDPQVEMDHASDEVAPILAGTANESRKLPCYRKRRSPKTDILSGRCSSQSRPGTALPEEFPRRVRVPVTPDTLSTYSIMRGNNGQDTRPLFDPLHSALFHSQTPDFQTDNSVKLPQIENSNSMGSFDSLSRDTNLYWDPLIMSNSNVFRNLLSPNEDSWGSTTGADTREYHYPDYHDYSKHHHLKPSGNHYTGDEAYANFGYLKINGRWVDPDSEAEIHKAKYEVTEGYNSKAELPGPRLDRLRSKGPKVMCEEEHAKFWKEENDSEEDNAREFHITPATFARWAEGTRVGDRYETKVMKPSEKLPFQTKEEALQGIPQAVKIRAPQFNEDTWSQMSGEYDVPENPPLIHDSHGYLNIDRIPNAFGYSNPQATLDFNRKAFLPAEDGSTYSNDSLATVSIPETFTNERAFREYTKRYDDKNAASEAFHEKEDAIFDLRDENKKAARTNAGLFRYIHGAEDIESGAQKGKFQLAYELRIATGQMANALTAAQNEKERLDSMFVAQHLQPQNKYQHQEVHDATFHHGGFGRQQAASSPHQATAGTFFYKQQDRVQNVDFGDFRGNDRYGQEGQPPENPYQFGDEQYYEGASPHGRVQNYYQGDSPVQANQYSIGGHQFNGAYNEGKDQENVDSFVGDQLEGIFKRAEEGVENSEPPRVSQYSFGGHHFHGICDEAEEEKEADHSIEELFFQAQGEAEGKELQPYQPPQRGHAQHTDNDDEELYKSDSSQEDLECRQDSSTSTLHPMQVYDQNLNPVSDSDTFPTPPDHNKRVRRLRKVSHFDLFSEEEGSQLRSFVFNDWKDKQKENSGIDWELTAGQENNLLEHTRTGVFEHVRDGDEPKPNIGRHENDKSEHHDNKHVEDYNLAQFSAEAAAFKNPRLSPPHTPDAPCHPFRISLLNRLCTKTNKTEKNELEYGNNEHQAWDSPLPAPQPRRISNLIQHMRKLSSSSRRSGRHVSPLLSIPLPSPTILDCQSAYIPSETPPPPSVRLTPSPPKPRRKRQYSRYFREELALQKTAKAQAARMNEYMNEDLAGIMNELESLRKLEAELSASIDTVMEDINQSRLRLSRNGYCGALPPLPGDMICPNGIFQGAGPFPGLLSPNGFQGGMMAPNGFHNPGPMVPQMIGGHVISNNVDIPSGFQPIRETPDRMNSNQMIGGLNSQGHSGQQQAGFIDPYGFQTPEPTNPNHYQIPLNPRTPPSEPSQITPRVFDNTIFHQENHMTYGPASQAQMVGGHIIPAQENYMTYGTAQQPQMVGGHLISSSSDQSTQVRPYFPFQTPTLHFYATPVQPPPDLTTPDETPFTPRRSRRGRITPEHFSGPLTEDQLPGSRVISGGPSPTSRYGVGGRHMSAAFVSPRPMLSTHFEGGTASQVERL